MQYFSYYDDSKSPAAEKIARIVEAYRARFGDGPLMVLVHPDDLTTHTSALVCTGESQGLPTNRNNFRVRGAA